MTQSESRLVQRPRWPWKTWGITSAILICFYLYFFFFTAELGEGVDSPALNVFFSFFSGAFASTFFISIFHGIRLLMFRTSRPLETIKISSEAERLQEELEANFFTNLVKINFKYLDKYYLQTQVQADKSFILSSAAAITGLAIIVSGIIMMYLNKTTPAYVATASGVLSELIAAVFFYLYNRTILRMSEYHQKLVLTQNIGLSLKIAESLPDDERVNAQQLLIKELTGNINQFLSVSAAGQ